MARPRVVLADDHSEILQLIAALLTEEFEVVDMVADGQALVEAACRLTPDVLVSDISMPGLSGIDAARTLMDAGSAMKVVFLTVHQDEDFVRTALATGAQGYVVKRRLATDLIPALREVLAGGRFISTRDDAPVRSKTP